MSVPNLRLLAARNADRVIREGQSLNTLLPALPALAPPDRALVTQLIHGVLRHYRHLSWLLDQLTDKPLRDKDHDLRMLCLVGLYQLLQLRVPDHAAVHETVKGLKGLRKPWAKGLVNAVLRRVQREREQWRHKTADNAGIATSHPDWLVEHLQDDWPDHWLEILTQDNQPAPMALRLNSRWQSRAHYLERLTEAGIDAHAVDELPDAIELLRPVNVEQLPGFEQGHVSVQDISAQRCAHLLAPRAGDRVLDACAAPGGKTAHLWEQQPELARLVAVENDAARLPRLHETLDRIGVPAEVHCADAGRTEQWWDGRGFDRILLDAPCSGTGVIRRHPDIKWLRRPSDLDRLAGIQAGLLQQLWRTLLPGGRLLYSTCSVMRCENDAVIEAFVRHCEDVEVIPLQLSGQLPLQYQSEWGIQRFPCERGGDGFYYSLLAKHASPGEGS